MPLLDLLAIVPPCATGAGVSWSTRVLGMLAVSDGLLAAFDPLVETGDEPFERQVPVGVYPVQIAIAHFDDRDARVALARVVLRDAKPTRWELAVRPGERVETLRAGHAFGYGVDSGTGCFASRDGYDVDDILAQLESNQVPTWTHAESPGRDGASVIAFSSGYGDGVYSSYWGLDDAGNVLSLVTDFGVAEIQWPPPDDRPDARAAHLESLVRRLRGETSAEGYPIAQEIGAFGVEARGYAGELLSMLAAPERDGQRIGLSHALRSIAREAPEVADLAAERWTDDPAEDEVYVHIIEGARQLPDTARRVLERIANDKEREPSVRQRAMSKLATHLGATDATMLFDRLVRDPAPAVRVDALRLLRDIDPPDLWAQRVELFVDDRSAEARRGLAQELGAWHREIDRWLPVLGPLLADMDPGVQIEAAVSLSRSAKHWSMALGVFEAALERDPDPDTVQPHASIFWALAESRVIPNDVARSLAGAWHSDFARHPAMDRIFDGEPAPRAKKSASAAKAKPRAKRAASSEGAKKTRSAAKPASKPKSPAAKTTSPRAPKPATKRKPKR